MCHFRRSHVYCHMKRFMSLRFGGLRSTSDTLTRRLIVYLQKDSFTFYDVTRCFLGLTYSLLSETMSFPWTEILGWRFLEQFNFGLPKGVYKQ